jgi:hypothetical protein
MATYPAWLHLLAWTYLGLCLACALVLALHTLLRPQRMAIMSLVWPITALYLGPFAVFMYAKSLPVLQAKPMPPQMHADMEAAMHRYMSAPPTFLQLSIAAFHCGAGCTLGDLAAEILVPALGLVFAGQFGSRLILDFLFAWILGIAFQYFSIVPMRGLSFGPGLAAAIRADTLSIAMFEVGMFGWMALSWYLFFPAPHLRPVQAVFWFMMQLAMIAGTLTALPANAWLIRHGWKEKMPMLDPAQLLHAMSQTPSSAHSGSPAV